MSSKHVKNVTHNSTNENASLTITTTTTSSSLATITLDELTTETTNINDISPSDTSQVLTEDELEYK